MKFILVVPRCQRHIQIDYVRKWVKCKSAFLLKQRAIIRKLVAMRPVSDRLELQAPERLGTINLTNVFRRGRNLNLIEWVFYFAKKSRDELCGSAKNYRTMC